MAQDATFDRTVLPISQPQAPTVTELDARNVTPPPPFAVKAPSKAPNVLIILLDDMGFGQPSAFGGPRGAKRDDSLDPRRPRIGVPRKVMKGGSHLCAPTAIADATVPPHGWRNQSTRRLVPGITIG